MGYYEIAELVEDLVTSIILSTLTKPAMCTSLTFLRSLLNALEIKKTVESHVFWTPYRSHGRNGRLDEAA